eukprot:2197303-Alexandrium_andersonii.AAC.1
MHHAKARPQDVGLSLKVSNSRSDTIRRRHACNLDQHRPTLSASTLHTHFNSSSAHYSSSVAEGRSPMPPALEQPPSGGP